MAHSDGAVRIRRARPEDAPRIAALYRQLVRQTMVSVLPERIAAVAEDARTALLVAARGDTVCGTALVCLCADVMFNAQPFAVVENLIVDAGQRGHGAGALLLSAVEAFCRDSDCSKIMLLSSAHRQRAHVFFERAGFLGSAKRGFVKYRSAFANLP